MEHLVGYDQAIIIDALMTGKAPGAVSVYDLNELPNLSELHISSPHDTSLQTALDLGRKMGAHLPEKVTVVGVDVVNLHDFSEELTPEVGASVPEAACRVLELLQIPSLVPAD
jgi:hydrogenase maturation protease